MIKKEESRASGEEAALWAALNSMKKDVDKVKSDVGDIKDTVDNNVTITIATNAGNRWDANGNKCVDGYMAPNGFAETWFTDLRTSSANKYTEMIGTQEMYRKIIVSHDTKQIRISGGCSIIPINYNTGHNTTDMLSTKEIKTEGFSTFNIKAGYVGSSYPEVPKGHMDFDATINGDFKAGEIRYVAIKITFAITMTNFDKSKFENKNVDCETIVSRLSSTGFTPPASCRSPKIQLSWNISY